MKHVKNTKPTAAAFNLNKTTTANSIQCAYRTSTTMEDLFGADALSQKWEDLDTIYNAAAYAIIAMGRSVQEVLAIPNLNAMVDNPNHLTLSVRALMNDLQNFTNILTQIHNNHDGRKGPMRDEKEHALSLNIAEQYTNFNMQYQSVTLPLFGIIMDCVNTALPRFKAEQDALLAATNTAVPETTMH